MCSHIVLMFSKIILTTNSLPSSIGSIWLMYIDQYRGEQTHEIAKTFNNRLVIAIRNECQYDAKCTIKQ